MSNTFPGGREYIVDQVQDVRGVGRRLHFVLPSGRSVWVNIGDEPDTVERRNMIADNLRHGKRYVRGAVIGPEGQM